jgi:hypothetical protein
MPESAILFFDLHISEKIPGFKHYNVPSVFPFWGAYSFFDLALSNVYTDPKDSLDLFTYKEHTKSVSLILSRWKTIELTIDNINIDIDRLVEFLKQRSEKKILFYNLGSLFLVEAPELEEYVKKTQDELVKLAVNDIPVDLYIADRIGLIRILEDCKSTYSSDTSFPYRLFSEVLHSNFETMINLRGKVLFQNNIMQLYKSNLTIIYEEERNGLPQSFYTIPKAESRDSSIAHSGFVKTSALSAGTKIEGYVENSVVFPGVHIREDARIINSVIMNHNYIGRKASVENTIVFPNFNENITSGPTVGERTIIGSNKSTAKNKDYPKQIASGLTVIGCNPDIPENFQIEGGCLIEADTPASVIKKMKKMQRGTSIRPVHKDYQ